MNQIPQLLVLVAVAQLGTYVPHIIDIQLPLLFDVHQSESSMSALLAEWVSLDNSTLTTLTVSSLMKDSKSRASDPTAPQICSRALKTN